VTATLRNRPHRSTSMVDVIRTMVEDVDNFPQLLPSELEQATRQADDEELFGNRRFARARVPLRFLARDLNVGAPTAGGNLVGSPRGTAVESLIPFSVLVEAGITVVPAPAGENPPGLPVVTSAPVAGWVNGEGQPLPESDAAFGLENVAPKTLGAWCTVSRRLMTAGGPMADAIIRSELMRAIGRGLDRAILQGTGASGQPQGLATLSGVGVQSGTSLAWSGIQAMRRAVVLGGARDDAVRVIAAPAVRELLAVRERAAGSGFIWDGSTVDGRPAHASLQCPTGALFVGDFSQAAVVLHGDLTLTVDRFGSTNGSARVLVMQDADIRFFYPAAFARATSIT
jgi:hypothetical protein